MATFWTVTGCLVVAECLRRIYLTLTTAFTGPLAKVPGPRLMRLTPIPWVISFVTGNTMYLIPQLHKQYGDIVRIGPQSVIVAGKEAVRKVLIEEDLMKSPILDKAKDDVNVSNIFNERNKLAHKQKRRLLSSGFSISYLKGLEPIMLESIQILDEVLASKCSEGKPTKVNIENLMSSISTDIMSPTSFGGSFELVRSGDETWKKIMSKVLWQAAIRAFLPFLRYVPFVKVDMPPEVEDTVLLYLEKRGQLIEKGEKKADLLQMLLDTHVEHPDEFTVEHLINEMILFMIAGSDTSATSMVFVLLLLVNNSNKYETLLEELDTAFPSRDSPITGDVTQNLPYFNAVIDESMRVMPLIAGGLERITTESTFLNGYEIPPDTTVIASAQVLMKDPRIWPDPESFIPERWLAAYKGVEADRKAFLPFSAGSRNCIGMQFAQRELRLVLGTVLRRYKIGLVEGQSHDFVQYTVPAFTAGHYFVTTEPRS